jgi:hypothetical protein
MALVKDAVGRPAKPGRPSRSAEAVTVHFLHAGVGQSVLIGLPANRWIIIDTGPVVARDKNPIIGHLRRAAARPNFTVLSVIITHYHQDHFGGMVDLIAWFKELSAGGRALNSILRGVILPWPYIKFRKHLGLAVTKPGVGMAPLKILYEQLGLLRDRGVPFFQTQALRFVWQRASKRPQQPWLFALHPDPLDDPEELLRALNDLAPEGTSAAMPQRYHKVLNRYSTVLGLGYGQDPQNLHCLFLADVPGTVFGDLTARLRDHLLPACQAAGSGAPPPGAAIDLAALAMAGGTRLVPTSAFTVPHHGSGDQPLKANDLGWWLVPAPHPVDRPSLAIVQGGEKSLKHTTVYEIRRSGCRLFATSRPRALLGAARHEDQMDRRRGTMRPPPPTSPRYRLVPSPPAASPNNARECVKGQSCLRVHGGRGGISRVVATNMFEIGDRRRIYRHDHCEVFRRP